MNRRSFLQTGSLHANGAHRRTSGTTAPPVLSDRQPHGVGDPGSVNGGDLSPYTPRPDKPWDIRRAAHLLRRIGFGPTWEEITVAAAATPAAIVDAALAATADAPFAKAWLGMTPYYPARSNDERAQYYLYARDLQEWWVGLMLQTPVMLREKMVLFWHNHFVSEYIKVETPHLTHRQNQLFRQYAFGDFRTLTKKVTIDAAMLIYLDGNASNLGNPNENYGRELLELFTLGVGAYYDGTPHYTEHDIIEMARALTGWRVSDKGVVSYNSTSHDNGAKTIFGTTANFGIEGHGDQDVIDHIFDQNDRDLSTKRAAVFLCTKLYQYFVCDQHPDLSIIAGMAATLVANNWQVGPVLRQLLLSEHFFDDNVVGARIKSPVEYTVGAMRQLNLANPMVDPSYGGNTRDYTNIATPEQHDPVTVMNYLAQALLQPPNVKGWPGGRYWVSSATVPLRIRYAEMWVDPIGSAMKYNFAPVTFIKTLPDAATDVNKVLDHLLELLLPLPITADARKPLLDELLGGGQTYEWDPDAPNAAPRIRACIIGITGLGEYQLI